MVPILPLSIPPDGPFGRREGRISRELRAYLRAEYNADEHWLFAQNHTVRGSIRVRVHDWLRRLRSLRNPFRRARAGESMDRGPRVPVGEAPLPHPFEAAIDIDPHALTLCGNLSGAPGTLRTSDVSIAEPSSSPRTLGCGSSGLHHPMIGRPRESFWGDPRLNSLTGNVRRLNSSWTRKRTSWPPNRRQVVTLSALSSPSGAARCCRTGGSASLAAR